MLCLLSGSALALDFSRFANQPGNTVNETGAMYGMLDIFTADPTKENSIFVMAYSYAIQGTTELPVLLGAFVQTGGGANQLVLVETDSARYTFTPTDLSMISGFGDLAAQLPGTFMLVDADCAVMYRDIATCENVTITMIDKGTRRNFELTDAHRQQMLLIADEYDEVIAPMLAEAETSTDAGLAWLKSVYDSVDNAFAIYAK